MPAGGRRQLTVAERPFADDAKAKPCAAAQASVQRDRPVVGTRFRLPTRTELEPRIFAGPAIVGFGWGLSGFCPGPALPAIGLAAPGTLVFVPAMIIGMWLARLVGEHPTEPAMG